MELTELIILIFGESIGEAFLRILAAATMAVGGATLIVDGLERFAKITPSTKDDQWVSIAKQKLGVVAAVLDRLAMNKRDK